MSEETPYLLNESPRPVEGPLSSEAFFARRPPAPGLPPVPRLALGTAWMGGVERAQAIETLHTAWRDGFPLADTAPLYRDGEVILAEALSAWTGDRPVVATKTKASSDPEVVRTRYAESRARLGSIDLLAVHDAQPDYPEESRAAINGFVSDLLEQGQIKTAGLGGGGPRTQALWLPFGLYRYVIVHLRLDAVTLQGLSDIVPLARRHGAEIVAASPMHLGVLGIRLPTFEEYPSHAMPKVFVERAQAVKRLSEEWNLPLTQLALRFVLSLPMVDRVLSGASTPEQWADCLAAYEAGPLPAELYGQVWQAAQTGAEPFTGG